MPPARFCHECGSALQPDGLCPRCLLFTAAKSGPRTAERSLPTADELTALFPAFELGELLGQGGMGLVYRARQRTLERPVALKLLAREIAAEPGFAERFTREARVLASLAHPHIVQVYEFGQAGPWFWFAMELVEGASLRRLLSERALSAKQSLALVTQICEALQYAHDRGVVHRDIKPENVLVDRAGQVKILDFGLSKVSGAKPGDTLTRTDQVMGTPHYMAPEQWERPGEVDHRADIYALGVVFYELLTGELPLGRFEPPSKKVEIDVRLDEVVLRTLAKEPERRYQQASEVKTEVERVSVPAQPSVPPSAPVPGLRVSPTPPPREPSGRTRAQVHLATLRARRSTQQSPQREPFPLLLAVLLGLGLLSLLGFSAWIFLNFTSFS
ncbi:MAG: serine/threonine-protein kinase [Planctomycetota bacterium]